MVPSELSARELEDALSLQQDLAEVFALAPGRNDGDSVDEVRRLCQLGRILIDDRPCQDCLELIERHAEYFFVVDDNVHWAWHTPKRYTKLRDLLLRLVRALGLRLCFLQIRQRSAEVSDLTRRTLRWLPPATADGIPRLSR